MNTPEERNANVHPNDDAQSDRSVDTGTPEVPEEITELAALLATAQANADMAVANEVAARAEYNEASRRLQVASNAMDQADDAATHASAVYRAALRRHGYVQTADGPKPRQP